MIVSVKKLLGLAAWAWVCGGVLGWAMGSAFPRAAKTSNLEDWCDTVQRNNGCPTMGTLELRPDLGRGAAECHCLAWELGRSASP